MVWYRGNFKTISYVFPVKLASKTVKWDIKIMFSRSFWHEIPIFTYFARIANSGKLESEGHGRLAVSSLLKRASVTTPIIA